MPPTPEHKKMMREKCSAMGWDLDTLLAVGLKLRPDPLTGKPEMEDLEQYLLSNPEDPDVQRFLQQTVQAVNKYTEKNTTCPKISIWSLPVQRNTIWFIKMRFGRLLTASGEDVRTTNKAGSSQEGVRQTFTLSCQIRVGPGLEDNALRTLEEYVGLPDSKAVGRFIWEAMTTPYPVFEPCLPNHLLISNNLKQHEAILGMLLNTLPKPFGWSIFPTAVEEVESEAIYLDSLERFSLYLQLANEKKDAGNKAFVLKDQAGAVDAYVEAIEYVQTALYKMKHLGEAREKEAKALQAICYANCAAARLLDGKGKDAKKALEDAKAAVEMDVYYAKGYIRLSRAYETLGNHAQAEESLAKALRFPQLENHMGLVDCLITLQTDGQGLPKDNKTCKEWSKKIFADGTGSDSESAERMRDVGGLWRKRCEGHRRKFGRQ